MADAAGGGGPRNPILDAVFQVVEHGADPAILKEVLIRASAEMEALREEVANSFGNLSGPVQDACANEIEQVDNALGVYSDGLALIAKYFKDRQIHTLTFGGETVRRGSFLVNEMLMNLRGRALVAMGPTDIPDFNLIHRLYTHVKKGTLPRDGDFAAMIDRMARATQSALADSEASPPSEGRDIALPAYRRQSAALALLQDYVREGREELLEKGMGDLQEAIVGVRDMMPVVQMKMRSQGPTEHPVANFTINMAVEVAAGNMGDKVLRDALEQLEANVGDMRRRFETLARRDTDSVLVAEEAQKVRLALDEVDGAVEYFHSFFANREGLLLSAACNRLRDAMNQLWESQKTFNEIAEREGKTLCLRCQHYNEKNRKTCQKCGAQLMMAAETGITSTFQVQDEATEGGPISDDIPVPANVHRIFNAVNAVHEGLISLPEFESEVAWFEGVVEAHAHYPPRPVFKPEAIPPEQKAQFEEVQRLTDKGEADLKEGIQCFRQGVAMYRDYLETTSQESLEEGTRVIWQGARKMHEVQVAMAPLKDLIPTQS